MKVKNFISLGMLVIALSANQVNSADAVKSAGTNNAQKLIYSADKISAWPYDAHSIQSITKTNPTLKLETPNTKELRAKVDLLSRADSDLGETLEKLLNIADNFDVLVAKEGAEKATDKLYQEGRCLEINYMLHNLSYDRNSLPADIKEPVEAALLLVAKKIEPVYAKYIESGGDNRNMTYARNYALLRYLETRDGFMILDGKWQKMPTGVSKQKR